MLMLDYQRKAEPAHRLGMAVLLVALATLGALGADYNNVAAALDDAANAAKVADAASVREHAARRERGAATGRRADADALALTKDIAQANRVLRDLSTPWDALFTAVEAAGGKDVTLLGLAPDAEKHTVKIVGEARNIVAALAYLEQLQRQPVLRDVHLQHHQVEQQDPDRPLRFTIVAAWEAES